MNDGMITIDVTDKPVLEALAKLSARAINMRPALLEIGEVMVKSTKERFVTTLSPEGKPWARNSPVTLARFGGAKRPLTGETGALGHSINYQLEGVTGVRIGSPLVYAAMQQFGGAKSKYPQLWGDIPARPFLGVSEGDSATIVEIVQSYLAG
jgi:phage virion morphogenesis protein